MKQFNPFKKTIRAASFVYFFVLMAGIALGQNPVTYTYSAVGAGTFSVTSSCITTVTVQCWGGGGGGGGGGGCLFDDGAGGGGGGGGFASGTITVSPGSYSYNVGGGGSGGNSSPNNGNSGGSTDFNGTSGPNYIVATGGGGGGSGPCNSGGGSSGGTGSGSALISSHNGGSGQGGSASCCGNGDGAGGGGGGAGSAGSGGNASGYTQSGTFGGGNPGGGGSGNGGSGGAGDGDAGGVFGSGIGSNGSTYGGGGGGGFGVAFLEDNYPGHNGAQGYMTVSYTIPVPTVTSFAPTSYCGTPSVPLVISGCGFTDIFGNSVVTSVTINGIIISGYNVNTAGTTITVPSSQLGGLSSGFIAVTTRNGGTTIGTGSTSGNAPPDQTLYFNSVPAAPFVSTPQVFCSVTSPTVADLTATGTAIQWYTSSALTSLLPGATPLVNGSSYYAAQTISGCQSAASAAVVAEITTTPAGGTIATVSYCSAGGPATVSVTGVSNATQYSWSLPANLTGFSTSSSISVSGSVSGSYTVTVTPQDVSSGITCSGTPVTGTVNVAATPAGGSIANSSFCSSTGSGMVSVTGVSNASQYMWSLPTGLSGTSASASITVSGTAPGTYTVTVTPLDIASGLTCAGPLVTGDVTILANPSITYVSGSAVACVGGNNDTIAIFAVSGNGSLHYSINGGTTYPNSTGMFTGLGAGSYNVAVEDDSNCITSYVGNPVSISQPASSLQVSAIVNDITCSGANDGRIALLPSGGWGAYTYAWSDGDSIQVISGLPAAVYTGTVTDLRGCSVSITDTIHNPTPIISQVTGTNVTCAGASNGSAAVTSLSGGSPPYTFLWSNFGITQNIDSLPGGLYYVIITDANGCQHRDSVRILEGLPLTLSDSVGITNCSGINNGAIYTTVSGGSGTYSYTWSPYAPNAVDDLNLSSGTYSVTARDGNGCSAVTSAVIVNTGPLAVSALTTAPLCYLGSDGGISLVVTGGTPQYNYSWSGLSGGAVISGVAAGTYYVTVTDAYACVLTDSVVITQPQPLIVSATPSNVSCYNYNNGSIIATTYGGTQPYSYQWHYGSLTGPLGPVTKDITQLSGGNYYLVVTDINNCTAAYHDSIANPDSLEISLVKQDASCQNAQGSVAVIVAGGTRPYQFLWNDFVTDSVQSGIPGGNYGVVVTDSNGCHQTESITVNGPPSPMTVNTAVSNPSCNDGTNGFISLDVHGGSPPYTYLWSTAPAQHGNVASNLTGGTYYVTISDVSMCQLLDTASLDTPAAITVSVGAGMTTCISSADGYAIVNVSGGAPPYTYQLGNSVQHTDTFTNLMVGDYTMIVKDVNGCEGSTALNITSTGNLTVHLTAMPDYILIGEPVQLSASATSDTTITAYIWNPLDSLNFQGCTDSSSCNDPIATPHSDHTYLVTVENARGCTATDTASVTISSTPGVFIPNAFTPNGDKLNDQFEFDILGAKMIDVEIWNRWGEKVFSNPAQPNGTADTHGWDGTYKGKGVQYDTYTYQLTVTYFDGHTQTIPGTVTVMK